VLVDGALALVVVLVDGALALVVVLVEGALVLVEGALVLADVSVADDVVVDAALVAPATAAPVADVVEPVTSAAEAMPGLNIASMTATPSSRRPQRRHVRARGAPRAAWRVVPRKAHGSARIRGGDADGRGPRKDKGRSSDLTMNGW
jgi:hypothetical protein